jgi:hypothetical protein
VNLWDELRQRKVVRVAAIYAAVAWGLTEVLGFLVDSFPFVPECTNTVVALVFVLGFPVSIFLAWMFDVGPGGRIRSTPGSVHGTFTIIAATVVLIAGTAGLFFLIYPGGPPASTPAEPIATTPQANAIAVLPFTNAGADAEDEYFADGLTDELITLLTQIDKSPGCSAQFCVSVQGQERGYQGYPGRSGSGHRARWHGACLGLGNTHCRATDRHRERLPVVGGELRPH